MLTLFSAEERAFFLRDVVWNTNGAAILLLFCAEWIVIGRVAEVIADAVFIFPVKLE